MMYLLFWDILSIIPGFHCYLQVCELDMYRNFTWILGTEFSV